MIGRIADLKFKNTDMEGVHLAKKIEFVLDDLLILVGAERKEVADGEEEESESDDDYWLFFIY